jgi:tetratricopeptide (TPR) repeat protein
MYGLKARALHNRPWRFTVTLHSRLHFTSAALAIAALVLIAGCKGGGTTRRPINTPGATPGVTPGSTTSSVQRLFESGRYQEVVNSVSAGERSAQAIWFAAQSSLRLGQRAEAASQFAQLPQAGGGPVWQVVSDLAQALLRDDAGEIDRARQDAAAFPGDPFAQYELGLAHARRNDMAAAAEAFDRVTQADSRFAYGYYNGGLAYDRLNRADLAISRLEMFVRLAPDAPERPEVTSILQTVRSR